MILRRAGHIVGEITDGLDICQLVFRRIGQRERLLHCHRKLHDVKRVRTQIVHKGRVCSDFVFVDHKLLGDHFDDLFEYHVFLFSFVR